MYVRSVALLELTSMLDTHNILYTRRRLKRKHKINYIYVFEADMMYVRSVALLELTSMLDTNNGQ